MDASASSTNAETRAASKRSHLRDSRWIGSLVPSEQATAPPDFQPGGAANQQLKRKSVVCGDRCEILRVNSALNQMFDGMLALAQGASQFGQCNVLQLPNAF